MAITIFQPGDEVVFLQYRCGEVNPIKAIVIDNYFCSGHHSIRIQYHNGKRKVTVTVKACNVVAK